MRKDLHGLTLSTDSGTAVDAFDRATQAYLKYRTDAARHLGAALKADPEFALGHVVRGYFNMLAYNKANIQGAADALAEARKHAKRTTTREAAHIEALARWVDGDLDRMLDVWRGCGLPPVGCPLARPAGSSTDTPAAAGWTGPPAARTGCRCTGRRVSW